MLASTLTLEVLFRTEAPFVFNAARRFGLSEADAEDVTQIVFVALQRRLHTLHCTEAVRPWLYAVTRRQAAAVRGLSSRVELDPEIDDTPTPDDTTPTPEEELIRRDRRKRILDLLEHIEPERRTVLIMHVLDDLPMTEVANALGIPLGTAYTRLRMARRDLRVVLQNQKEIRSGIWVRSDSYLTVRETPVNHYGFRPPPISTYERMWRNIVWHLWSTHGSLRAAARGALRIRSSRKFFMPPQYSVWDRPRKDSYPPPPPDWYPVGIPKELANTPKKRQPKYFRELLALRALRARAVTESRTPSAGDRKSASASRRPSRP